MQDVTLLSFATKNFKARQAYLEETAYKRGHIRACISANETSIDAGFITDNRGIFSLSRGFGLWLWKPYLVRRFLEEIRTEYLMYSDAGAYFKGSVEPIISTMKSAGVDLMFFDLPLIEGEWTKRDALILAKCDSADSRYQNQVSGSFFILRKSRFAYSLIDEWLSLSSDKRALSDERSVLGEDFPEFISHRHDQSILSVLVRREGLKTFRDPSQRGTNPHEYYVHNASFRSPDHAESSYPEIIEHYRHTDCYKTWPRLIFKAKVYFRRIGAKMLVSPSKKCYKINR